MKIRISKRSVITGVIFVLASSTLASMSGLSYGAESNAASIEAGKQVATDRKLGNCYSCHAVIGAELAGNAGPPLIQMKSRYPDRAVLRAQISDPRIRNQNTIMPPYGAHSILSERQLDQVVDYVLSL